MRSIIFVLLVFFSQIAVAEPRLVLQWTDNTRIVMSKESCLVPTLKGNRAVVQRIDGKFIRGCWYVDPHNANNYRIDWNNPAKPGDFAVIEMEKFTYVE